MAVVWETTAPGQQGARPLLPKFRSVVDASGQWAGTMVVPGTTEGATVTLAPLALSDSDRKAIKDGEPVRHAVYSRIGLWIVRGVSAMLPPGKTLCGPLVPVAKCLELDVRKVRAARGWSALRGGKGYVMVEIGKDCNGDSVWEYAHRLVMWARAGVGESGGDVLHGDARHTACKSMRCVNPHHLRWGTQAANLADMARVRARNPRPAAPAPDPDAAALQDALAALHVVP
jgi:hypothetical protein